MKMLRQELLLAGMLMLASVMLAQERAAWHGSVDAGARDVWGDVYGRPDLPFTPALRTSDYNEYRDIRDGFFIRRFYLFRDDRNDSKYFVNLQSDRAIYRDQSYLGTVGAWNRFQVQIRYDEIPHTYSNLTRTLYAPAGNGVLTIPAAVRNNLQTLSATSPTSLPGTIESQLVPSMNFVVPAVERRTGGVRFIYHLTPGWDLAARYSREHDSGTRPLGLLFNSSPSASLTGGYGAEVPEPINYLIDTAQAGTEYGRRGFSVRAGYEGSFFRNQTGTLTFDNPFLTADCVAPSGCTTATQGAARGEVDLYPGNQAHYLNFAGTFLLPLNIRLLASINAGWLRQNDAFVPYTSNSILEAQTAALPASSLHGDKQTLAMNYKLIRSFGKKFDLRAGYRQYDYDNDTPILNLTPVEGDIGAPNLTQPTQNAPFGYNRKTVEATGNWYFADKSSLKAGYEGEILDRSNRDVAHSSENGLVTAVDSALTKQLSLRASYRYSVRNPEHYVDESAQQVSGGITGDSVFSRRFDEAARTRNHGELEVSYSPTDRLTVGGFGGTLQDNFNRPGGVNSAAPLNFATTTASPYYLYGMLKNLSYDGGFSADFVLTERVSWFGEYSWERYYTSMVSRYRVPGSTAPTPLDCSLAGHGCDSANNDWGGTAHDLVHVFSTGVDLHPQKKVSLSTGYTLSAAKGIDQSRAFGDPTIATGPDKFLLTGTNAAVDFPDTVSRSHQLSAMFRYKLSNRLTPKVEYRYEQFDNKDFQTTAMTPYMGCVSPLPPGAALPGCSSVLLGTASQYYPYSTVGDTSAARYLFLGADQPSYRAHLLAGSLEYQF